MAVDLPLTSATAPASHPVHSSAFGPEGRGLLGRKYKVHTAKTMKRPASIPVIHPWNGSG